MFEPAILPYRDAPHMVEPDMLLEPLIPPYMFTASTVEADTDKAVMEFDPTTFPNKSAPDTNPSVLIPNSETYVFAPIDKRLRGFEFAIPMLPDVMREFPGFVNCTVLDVVFPLSTTAWRVVANDDVVMELSLPFESIVS